MKLSMRFSKRVTLLGLGVVMALTAIAVIPNMTKASFGPGRETKAYTDGVAGFDHVTFNSFTGVPGISDERQFFSGKYDNGGTAYGDPMADVRNGDTMTLIVYVHNGADASLNDKTGNPGVATNTKVRVALPTTVAKTQQATAYVSADNAQPKEVYDTIDFGSANGAMFGLEYVPGSAKLTGNYLNTPLSDSVVTTGAAVGTNALDGKVKGCFKEMVYVTLQVKVKMPDYSLNKQVRMKGQTSADWTETKDVKAGDTTQWMLTFKNTGQTPLTSVSLVDQVPAGMTVVPGSVKLINGNYPSGYVYPASAVQENGRTVNVNIGNYNADAAGIAYVLYDTTIDTPGKDVCTTQKLVNKAFATPQGFGAIWDDASVNVPGNNCTTNPTPSYSCDGLDVTVSDSRKAEVTVKYTAKDGATYKSTTFTWGDNTADTTGTDTKASHQYAADGTYNVTAKVLMSVNGTDKYAEGGNCSKQVTVKAAKPTPTYTCDLLTLTAGTNRKVTAKVDYTGKDGAKLKMVTYNWGDNSTPLVTDKTSADYTYAKDGTYSVNVKLLFNVDGTDKYAPDTANCVKSVTYTSPATPVTPAPTTPAKALPDTGAGSVIGLFGLVSVLSALAYRLVLGHRVNG
ncbi:DUF11 domain-containing protein [Candidatus Saccharibacteria bacterium]|nr:DUF11 domain-containing protein [Candidatus Saccharibacteria bacterium]